MPFSTRLLGTKAVCEYRVYDNWMATWLPLLKQKGLEHIRDGQRNHLPAKSSLILYTNYVSRLSTIPGLGYGPLMRAIHSEDEYQVRGLLSDETDTEGQPYLNERSREDETPLHVAVGWPTGLSLLFELGRYFAQALV